MTRPARMPASMPARMPASVPGRLVVTGATGNVGTALLDLLRGENIAVTAVTTRDVPPAGEPYDSARWIRCDLRDRASVAVLAEQMRGSAAVVHLAWDITGAHRRARQFRTNVVGTGHVLAAATVAEMPFLVYLSSVAAYAPDPHRQQLVDEHWPLGGIPGSAYSADKVAVERLLDVAQRRDPRLRVARLRPPAILQSAAGGELVRYALGRLAPLLRYRWLRPPVLPLPDVATQVVHAADVAGLIVLVLRHGATGAFNAAAEPVLRGDDLAAAVGVRRWPVPGALVRAAMATSSAVRLQPLDRSWWDMFTGTPLVSARRARDELGWRPAHNPQQTLADTRRAVVSAEGTGSPRLAPP